MRSLQSIRDAVLILGAVILLAGCGGQNATQATPTPPVAPTATVQATAVPTATAQATAVPTVAPTPTTTPEAVAEPIKDPITGAAALGRAAITQRPIAVMIDNHPNAYPQSGIDKAAVVFEALAEFGITRFMVLFAPGITPDIDEIGPVRSARVYFVQWAMGFNAAYVHAGGSPQGLELAESTDQIVNIDALRSESASAFERSDSREAPHNLFTGSAALAKLQSERNVPAFARKDLGFLFKPDVAESLRPASQTIDYYFLYREDNAGWKYDRKTNSYLRSRKGKPAVDAVTGEQLRAKNVVVIEVQQAPIADDPKGRIEQMVVGSGRARIIMDGAVREATWRKPAAEAALTFVDASGVEIRLNAGQVWITVLPSLDTLTIN